MIYPDDVRKNLPNCGVVAVALMAGVSYEEAHEKLAAQMMRPKAWRGRTFLWQRLKVLEVDLKVPLLRHRHIEGCTLNQFYQSGEWALFDGPVMFQASRHVMVLHGDRIYDQHYSSGFHISTFKGRRGVIKSVFTQGGYMLGYWEDASKWEA